MAGTPPLEHALEASRREDDERTGALGVNLEGERYAAGLSDPGAGTADELVVSHAEAGLCLEDIHGFKLAAVDVEQGPVSLLEEGSLEETVPPPASSARALISITLPWHQ